MIAIQTNFTSKTKTRVLIMFLTLATGALFTVLFLHSRAHAPDPAIFRDEFEAIVKRGDLEIPVSVADTSEEQEQGLSGTLFLPPNTGKLFVFNTDDRYGFWMKDMRYPIDIIWIDKDMRIVDITHDIASDSYPKIFYPSVPVRYVLEVNAGFSTVHQLIENQLLEIQENLSF
jgi:uncharacterized membrane protein (UPF0127 family)